MKKIILLTILGVINSCVYSQIIDLTFSGYGESDQIDSVLATNLESNQKVILYGDEVLRISYASKIMINPSMANSVVYPNPANHDVQIDLSANHYDDYRITVVNSLGKTQTSWIGKLQAGHYSWKLSLMNPGIYFVLIQNEDRWVSHSLVKTTQNHLPSSMALVESCPNSDEGRLKSEPKTLYANSYENIHFECYSGPYTTIIVDQPVTSKNYEVEFIKCLDQGSSNYKVAVIGEQIWMAENLSYLPSVVGPDEHSDEDPCYYVYDYEGTNVEEAKATDSFINGGVLYNWAAVMNGDSPSNTVPSGVKGICPDGWHLPSDDEWKILEINLGMRNTDADEQDWRNSGNVGERLKSTSGWNSEGNGDNSGGFNALPVGLRHTLAVFNQKGNWAVFWSSSVDDDSRVVTRALYMGYDGVKRDYDYRGYGFSVRCLRD